MRNQKTYLKQTLSYFNKKEHQTSSSIFTLRFSRFGDVFANSIVSKFTPYIKNEQINALLIFKEGTQHKKNIHFHVRLETNYFWIKQKLYRDLLKKSFTELTGNAQLSCHPCKEKDKHHDNHLGASKTYIAKEGNLIYKYGYTDLQIEEMIYHGRLIANYTNAPIYKKIILLYNLKKIPESKLPKRKDWRIVVTHMQQFYEENNKGYVNNNHITKTLAQNIMKELSYTYRINSLHNFIEQLTLGE